MRIKSEFTEKEKTERTRRANAAILKGYPTIAGFIREFRKDYNPGEQNHTVVKIINHKNICRYHEFCKKLRLDPFDLSPLNEFTENRKVNLLENRILAMYCDLNRKGRLRFFELLTDLWSIEKYRRV